MSTPMTPVASDPGRRLLRHWVLGAVAAACAAAALAQETQGNLSGQATPGATVVMLHLASGQTRTVTADAQGRFHASRLMPGDYRVSTNVMSQDVTVAVGVTSDVWLRPVDLGTVRVDGRRRGTVDVQSVESPSVFTSEQLDRLPLARDVQAVARLAPGVSESTVSPTGTVLARLSSISGASAAENTYYINGMDVTELRSMLSYATVPLEGVEQLQVKTGGYGAEFGRSVGGVMSIITKRGANAWRANLSAEWSPDALRARSRNIIDLNPDNASPLTKKPNYRQFNGGLQSDTTKLTLDAGGPLVPGKLFVFAQISRQRQVLDGYASSSSVVGRIDLGPSTLLKLDWVPNGRDSFELTAIRTPFRRTSTRFSNTQLDGAPPGTSASQLIDDRWFATRHFGTPTITVSEASSGVLIAKYSGVVSDKLSWSALVGRTTSEPIYLANGPSIAPDCPVVYLPNGVATGCWNPATGETGRDPAAAATNRDRRLSFRLDAEYVLGQHTLRWGIDSVRFTSTLGGDTYIAGGSRWNYFNAGTGSLPDLVPPGQQYVQESFYATESGGYSLRSSSTYVEDAWQISPRWRLNLGLRSERFDNRTAAGTSFVKASAVTPRLGAVWNVHGDGSMRVYASAGRYHIPIPADVNIAFTRGSTSYEAFYTFTGRDPRTGVPTGLSAPIDAVGSRSIKPADPTTLVDPHLKPMSQDEWTLGLQKAVNADWTVGAKATWRRLNDGVDDLCSAYGIKRWALDQGYTNFDASTIPGCLLINPGRDVHAKLDLNNDGQLSNVIIPASYIGLPAYERRYRALELTLERRFSSVASLGASYVWSQLRGNIEGYVQSTSDGRNIATSVAFDFASLMDGAYGPLPGDRRHVIKAYGHYQPTPQWRIGANVLMQSGAPKSCRGFVPRTAPDYAPVDGYGGAASYTSATSFYCLGDDKQTRLTQRGSLGRLPWTYNADLTVSYLPQFAAGRLVLQASVFNVMDARQTTFVDQQRDLSRANTNLQYSSNPNTRAAVRFNPNYDQIAATQAPRTVQLTLRYQL